MNIIRWIDLDSQEFDSIEDSSLIKKLLKEGMKVGAISVDQDGYMTAGQHTVHVEIGTELVGIRYSAKASN